MPKEHRRLGDLLIESKTITPEQLEAAIAEHKRTGMLLGATLIKMGMVTERELLLQLQRQLDLQLVDLDDIDPDESALALVKEELAKKHGALPLEVENKRTLVVAMADPLNVAAIEDLRFATGKFIRPVLASPASVFEAIERYYHIDNSVNEVIQNIINAEDEVIVNKVEEESAQAVDDLMREAEGRPIVRLTNWILRRGVEDRASDIHIEPQDKELIIRFRIDGLLHEVQRLPKWTQGAFVSRIKVLSNLDIAEKRQPQDGRMSVEVDGRQVDMRVSSLPITNGEKIVIRVIDQRKGVASLDELGVYPDDLERMKHFLDRPQGIVLVTGPTGSGKSTLLYGSLKYMHHVTKNIITVEDPVERSLKGINQVQVDEKAKKTFAAALRSILRQDPDIIMIGEIRDKETAQIAFRASVTGHLVLSTVHTNDAAGAVTRLIDLGLDPFMVASALLEVVSMRLVRTICSKCKESYEAPPDVVKRLVGMTDTNNSITLYRGKGCAQCHETGYSGRTGIYERLEMTDAIKALVLQNASDTTIRRTAIDQGMRVIGQDGLRKVLDGKTTLEEVARVVYFSDQAAKLCPCCKAVVTMEYQYCPSCGEFVGDLCTKCSRRMTPEWEFCPACGHASDAPNHRAARAAAGKTTPSATPPAKPADASPERRGRRAA